MHNECKLSIKAQLLNECIQLLASVCKLTDMQSFVLLIVYNFYCVHWKITFVITVGNFSKFFTFFLYDPVRPTVKI